MFASKTAHAWGKRLDRFDRADVTVAQFCLREGVSQASFYHWRRKLRGQPSASAPNQDPSMPRFLPVSLTPTQTTSTASTPPPSVPQSLMTIDLPGGIRIRFEIPADHQHDDQLEARP